jgi:hypothetical protein
VIFFSKFCHFFTKNWEICGGMCFSIVNPTKFSVFFGNIRQLLDITKLKKIKPWLVAPQKGKDFFFKN